MLSPTRQRIMSLVEREPALSLGQLKVRTDLGWGALYHHLRRLEEGGLLRFVRAGKRRLVVSARGDTPDAVLRAMAELHGRRAAQVARLVAEGRARDSEAVARELGISARAARYHLARLSRAGLVVPGAPTRHAPVVATPVLIDAIRRVDNVSP